MDHIHTHAIDPAKLDVASLSEALRIAFAAGLGESVDEPGP